MIKENEWNEAIYLFLKNYNFNFFFLFIIEIN